MPTLKRCLCSILLAMLSGYCNAEPLTVTWSGNASGFLGNTAFTDTDFTFISTGNTDSDIVNGFPATRFTSSGTTLSLDGLGRFEVHRPLEHFINEPSEFAGFNIQGGTRLAFRAFRGAVPANSPSDFHSDLGPITAIGNLLQWDFYSLPTSGGGFTFIESAGIDLTFQVRVVPEPTSGLLLLCGTSVLVLNRSR